MPRSVAFLRAVNVGGRTVKMEALRAAFEALALGRVQTFIASGNVVFDHKARDVAALERRIEAQLQKAFGFEIDTFVRTLDEIAAVAAHPTFDGSSTTEVIGFLRTAPDSAGVKAMRAMATDVDRLQLHGRELIWTSDQRQSDSVFSNAAFERALKVRSTFRGVNTLRKLLDKHREES